ncbi:hypothetical protein HK096_003086 [Nowakowskiella sp. JEL0078]|nr:hypothetical protein HK096_003086 [Nowakowskiella sp. JEL0078]
MSSFNWIFVFLALLNLFVWSAVAKSVSGDRLLVIFDSVSQQNEYSLFLASLKDRGFNIDVAAASDASVPLFMYEFDRQYDHLVLFSPKSEKYANGISAASLISFLNSGGNVLIAVNSEISSLLHGFALEFSVDFDDTGALVHDFFNQLPESSSSIVKLISSNVKLPSIATISDKPLIYSGIAHRVSGKNPLVKQVVVGHPSTFSETQPDSVSSGSLAGSQASLITSVQARNNARIIFSGSLDIFSDK